MTIRLTAWAGLLAGLMLVVLPAVADDGSSVRLSRTGVCHEPGSANYARLRDYRSFRSLEDCLAAGGRPVGGGGTAPVQTPGLGAPARLPGDPWSLLQSPVVAVVMMLVLAAAAGWGWLAWQRSRQRAYYRRVADEERRRWEGHRRERPTPGRPGKR